MDREEINNRIAAFAQAKRARAERGIPDDNRLNKGPDTKSRAVAAEAEALLAVSGNGERAREQRGGGSTIVATIEREEAGGGGRAPRAGDCPTHGPYVGTRGCRKCAGSKIAATRKAAKAAKAEAILEGRGMPSKREPSGPREGPPARKWTPESSARLARLGASEAAEGPEGPGETEKHCPTHGPYVGDRGCRGCAEDTKRAGRADRRAALKGRLDAVDFGGEDPPAPDDTIIELPVEAPVEAPAPPPSGPRPPERPPGATSASAGWMVELDAQRAVGVALDALAAHPGAVGRVLAWAMATFGDK